MQSSSLPAIFAFLLTKEKIISSAYYSQRTPFFFLYSSWEGVGESFVILAGLWKKNGRINNVEVELNMMKRTRIVLNITS